MLENVLFNWKRAQKKCCIRRGSRVKGCEFKGHAELHCARDVDVLKIRFLPGGRKTVPFSVSKEEVTALNALLLNRRSLPVLTLAAFSSAD